MILFLLLSAQAPAAIIAPPPFVMPAPPAPPGPRAEIVRGPEPLDRQTLRDQTFVHFAKPQVVLRMKIENDQDSGNTDHWLHQVVVVFLRKVDRQVAIFSRQYR